MTREEAAKDPKRNPKKRRANYTQNQERQPGKTSHYNHAQKRQSIRTHNGKTRSGTAASIRHNARNAHRTTKGATDEETHAKQNKSPQRAIYEARTGHRSTAGKHPKRKRRQDCRKPETETGRTATNTKRRNTSPTESRNDHSPNKYTQKPQNAIQSEIIKPPTKDGHKNARTTGNARKITFY